MRRLFRYKVFRQKMLRTTAGILFIAVIITAASYSFLRAGWIGLAQERSGAFGREVEHNLQNEDDLLTLQITGAYASEPLMDDILSIFKSRTFEDYLEARLSRSQTSAEAIRSFPEYIRAYIRRYGSSLEQIAFHGEGFTHVIRFGMGEIVYEFGKAAFQPPGIGESLALRKPLYNPLDNYSKIGEVSFYFKTESIVAGVDYSGFTLAALQDGQGNLYDLRAKAQATGEIPKAAAFVQELGRFPYKAVTYTGDGTLVRENFSAVAVLALVMALLCAASVLFFFYNIRYDFAFIEDIFLIINDIKRGVFHEADNLPEKRYSRNEYGRIARELGDMSLKLKRHIETEYELKIRQQQTEMRLLQNQINPHFLYNTLEAISAQALLNHDKPTADSIIAMGALFRDMASLPSQIPMKDEMRILQAYLRVMEFKYAGSFCYHLELPRELEDFPTVKFWLQPLAENFFNHGYDPANPYNLLIVRAYRDEGAVCVDIADNGPHLPEERLAALNENVSQPEAEAGGGLGLRNVYWRLSMFYGGDISMRIANGEESGVAINVRINAGGEKNA
jgi:ABC-type multidrug transport system fused ATPase/permease subunit